MAPSTPTRSRKSTSKKRTRQDRADTDNNIQQRAQNEDSDLESPEPKKRNTAKTPTKNNVAAQETPVRAKVKGRHRTANQAPPPSPPVQETKENDEEVIDVFAPTVKANDDNHNQANNAGTGKRLLYMLQKTANTAKATIKTSLTPLAAPQEKEDKKAADSATTDITDNDANQAPSASPSNDSFFHGRQFLWYCLLLGTFLALICGLLWASVVIYDMTDYEMELNQCHRSLAAANRQLSTSSSAKDKYYLQELEKQAHYWKKQAKQNEAFAQGYKEEYQAILKQLHGNE